MRQRIRAVETIKKITHAMRLIAMSTRSRLRHKKVHLEEYRAVFQRLWSRMGHFLVTTQITATQEQPHLIILVGSQKGLCGPFNSSLFKFFETEEPTLDTKHHLIAVGKHATDYFTAEKKLILASYNNLSASQFVSIAQGITTMIIQSPIPYATVTVYSMYQKNFFVQKPKKSQIYPFAETEIPVEKEQPSEILFEQSPEELSATIRQLMLAVTLQEILFESLLAEQAARFLTMDSATRNADKLLVSMKLEYNKLRQTAITRELTELSSSIS